MIDVENDNKVQTVCRLTVIGCTLFYDCRWKPCEGVRIFGTQGKRHRFESGGGDCRQASVSFFNTSQTKQKIWTGVRGASKNG
jgi:hypothetical protein